MTYKMQQRKNAISSCIAIITYFIFGFASALLFINWKSINLEPSLIISVCAFFLTFYQFYQIRLHNRISIKPLILAGTFYGNEEIDGVINIEYDISIKNSGLGIANIFDYKLLLNNKSIDCDTAMDKISNQSLIKSLHDDMKIDLSIDFNYFLDGYYLKKMKK